MVYGLVSDICSERANGSVKKKPNDVLELMRLGMILLYGFGSLRVRRENVDVF